jgi:hypothetical protein
MTSEEQERYDGFSEQEFAAINYLNARELFSRVGGG